MDYWQEIEKEIDTNGLKVDKEKIKLALFFAEECHQGQYRRSGDHYILHPVEVTKNLDRYENGHRCHSCWNTS